MSSHATVAEEEYLQTIFWLHEAGLPMTGANVARAMQLSAHTVERVYRALTLGVPRPGVIDTLYDRHPRSRLRFTSRTSDGKRAVTHVSVLEKLAGGQSALIACRLETGRLRDVLWQQRLLNSARIVHEWIVQCVRSIPGTKPYVQRPQ